MEVTKVEAIVSLIGFAVFVLFLVITNYWSDWFKPEDSEMRPNYKKVIVNIDDFAVWFTEYYTKFWRDDSPTRYQEKLHFAKAFCDRELFDAIIERAVHQGRSVQCCMLPEQTELYIKPLIALYWQVIGTYNNGPIIRAFLALFSDEAQKALLGQDASSFIEKGSVEKKALKGAVSEEVS